MPGKILENGTYRRRGPRAAARDRRAADFYSTEPARGRRRSAAIWPQWRGPERNEISKETGLLKTWPEGGPSLAWKVKNLGGGYCTPSVSHGRIYGMSYRGNDEVVWALNESDGKEGWK